MSGAKRESGSQKDKQAIYRALCQDYLKMLGKHRQENVDWDLNRIFKLQKSSLECLEDTWDVTGPYCSELVRTNFQ